MRVLLAVSANFPDNPRMLYTEQQKKRLYIPMSSEIKVSEKVFCSHIWTL